MIPENISDILKNKSTAECCMYLYNMLLPLTDPKNEEVLAFKKAGTALMAVKHDNRLAKSCMYLYNKLKQNDDDLSREKARVLYNAAQLLKTGTSIY